MQVNHILKSYVYINTEGQCVVSINRMILDYINISTKEKT